jgi:hypothetical protein
MNAATRDAPFCVGAARLHAVERNRLFREGIQWVSSIGFGPWRTPPGPKDAVRYVHNMFDDALDQRHEILIEQRPGFSTKPTRQDPDSIKKAEGQQIALEYQYGEQHMQAVLGEMGYWVGTDGVCFAYTFWDPDKGPWHETSRAGKAMGFALGDPRTRVYRVEQVRVSPNATATEKPYWCVLREEIPLGQAVAEHGDQVVAEINNGPVSDAGYSERMRELRDRYGATTDEDMFGDDETTDRLIVLVPASEYLPEGLMLVVVGNAVVYQPSRLLPDPVPTSDWRSDDYNDQVGGASDSAHEEVPCNAIDIGERPRPDDPSWNYSRWRIVTAAINLGCKRIGMYANGSLHLDRTEGRRPSPRIWRVARA